MPSPVVAFLLFLSNYFNTSKNKCLPIRNIYIQKRVSPPFKCVPSNSCVPLVMTAVTVRIMDRGAQKENFGLRMQIRPRLSLKKSDTIFFDKLNLIQRFG